MYGEPINLWRKTFKEGWECQDCKHKHVIMLTPEGYPLDDVAAPIPQRMCLASSAWNCPGVKDEMDVV